MLSVQNIFGVEEPFSDFTGLRKIRKVNGEKVVSLTIFDTDTNHDAYPLIEEESTIFFNDEEYIIKTMTERSVGKRSIKQVEAVHKFYVDLINKQQHNVHNGSITFHDYMTLVFQDTGYTFQVIDQFFARSFENLGEESRLGMLQKGLDRFGAEMELNGTQVTFKSRVGDDTDFQFRYGHNIKTIERHVDTKNLATVIRGKGDPELEINAYYRSDNADIFGEIDAPTINDERFKSEESLLEEMIRRLQDIPEFSITIDFVDLRAAGYPYTVPNEGDSVFVIYEPMQDLKIETRILEIEEEFDVNLKPIKTSVTLANYKKTFAGTLFDNVNKQLDGIVTEDGVIRYNVLDNAVKIATESLLSARTELIFENGIIAREEDNPNHLVVFNSKGLGISSDGGQTFREAITADGFVLSAGAIGRLSANHISIGPDTTFEDGYDPTDIEFDDSHIRQDLNLTAPLPTAIRMNDTGITAWTPNDDGYARLDYRGLYIAGGAIQIDNGLPDDQIENAGKWNGQGTYIDEEGVYTGTLTANQISSGRINSEHIQIGPDTAFEDGYDPTDIDYGTRNLIPHTDFREYGGQIDQWSPWGSHTMIWQAMQAGKYMLFRNANTNQTGSGTIGVVSPNFTKNVITGREYTIRFLGVGNALNNPFEYCYLMNVDNEERADGNSGSMSVDITKITHNYEIRSGNVYADLYELTFVSQWTGRAAFLIGSTINLSALSSHWISEPMLVEGNKTPKDWTPAPEDIEEQMIQQDDKIRQDLRLEAPLPTSISMNSTGITASTSNSNNFARLDHRGLYVQGGAIQISGGLPDDQIENSGKWNQQGTHIDENGIYTGTVTAQQVQVGFNDVSDSVRIVPEGLETYDGNTRTSQLSGTGHRFYDGGAYLGQVGATRVVNRPNVRGIRFHASDAAEYMAWSVGGEDETAQVKLTWAEEGGQVYTPGFVFYDNVDFRHSITFRDNGSIIQRHSDSLRIANDVDLAINLFNTGTVGFAYQGSTTHAFFADGTKTGGSIEIDGTRYGMSPIDSPQVLIEYIEFDVELSRFGTKVMLDETYLKSVTNFAVFLNNGELVSKGKDHIIIKGEGLADIRFVGERIEHDNVMWADMQTEEDEEVIEHEPEEAPKITVVQSGETTHGDRD